MQNTLLTFSLKLIGFYDIQFLWFYNTGSLYSEKLVKFSTWCYKLLYKPSNKLDFYNSLKFLIKGDNDFQQNYKTIYTKNKRKYFRNSLGWHFLLISNKTSKRAVDYIIENDCDWELLWVFWSFVWEVGQGYYYWNLRSV